MATIAPAKINKSSPVKCSIKCMWCSPQTKYDFNPFRSVHNGAVPLSHSNSFGCALLAKRNTPTGLIYSSSGATMHPSTPAKTRWSKLLPICTNAFESFEKESDTKKVMILLIFIWSQTSLPPLHRPGRPGSNRRLGWMAKTDLSVAGCMRSTCGLALINTDRKSVV